MDEAYGAGEPGDAFAFTGTWREYLPIAASNLLLTIVTIGIYRFWAKARERRYLWSRTRFIDDRLEWTGTGREMFVGFVVALLLFTPPLLFLRFGLQAMVLRGYGGSAALLGLFAYVFFLYAFGFARFRALRYRLTRSYWHGIRGGSDDPGFAYGWSATWKTVVGFLALALMVPWSMVQLWNERWRAMSFGPYRFGSDALAAPLMLRWLALLFSPILAGLVIAAIGVGFVAAWSGQQGGAGTMAAAMIGAAAVALGLYLVIGLIGLFYYALYFRHVVGHLSLGELRFQFGARSMDWLKLFLGDVALLIGTLGLGVCFLGYRHWSFLICHLGATGSVDLAQVTQSTTRAPREAEGLADAFDLGAI